MPPEWRPADLGGPVTIPEVDPDRRKYDVPTTRARNLYVAAEFAVAAAIVFVMLWYKTELGVLERAMLAGLTLWALYGWGALFERRGHAVPLEAARLGATALGLSWLASKTPQAWPLGAAAVVVTITGAVLLARGRVAPAAGTVAPVAAE
jgi:hypothetical protein